MPNWCFNTLEVTGYEEEDLQKFKEDVKDTDTDLSLNKLVPMPVEFDETGGYEWRLSNWGTKWDVCAKLAESDNSFLLYDFESAWVPPLEWLYHVITLYPTLRFFLRYEEYNNGIVGIFIGEDGEIQTDECINY